ncbi:DNA-binding protein [Nocardia sp. NPDC059246]|uniref:DNA-binding protein n=1 Tax=unclassified Nocardia TaxID=2637762 RepID=UPI003681187C
MGEQSPTLAVSLCGECRREFKPLRRGLCNRCYERNRYRQNAYGRWNADRVDATPVRAHVEALNRAGMSLRQICAAAGMSRQSLAVLLRGKTGRGPALWVQQSTADAFLSVPLPESVFEAAAPQALVPALGTRRRLQALVAAGWTMTVVAGELGMQLKNLAVLLGQDQVTARRHRQVAALFDRLQMQPGPSKRARAMGRKRRWPLPFQWDEGALDDPEAGPVFGTRREPYRKRVSA